MVKFVPLADGALASDVLTPHGSGPVFCYDKKIMKSNLNGHNYNHLTIDFLTDFARNKKLTAHRALGRNLFSDSIFRPKVLFNMSQLTSCLVSTTYFFTIYDD